METIASVLKKSISFLKEKGFDEARRTAELLLAHTLQLKRIDLYLRFDKPLSETELEAYRDCVKRRLKHEPTQYIIGSTEFYGVEFAVSSAALIPRSDTEHLVDAIIETVRNEYPDKNVSTLDIGTGTGAIPIAVLSKVQNISFTAIDISSEALNLAKKNAECNHCEDSISFLQIDILTTDQITNAPFDIVVSNPPYISNDEFEKLAPEIKDFEPKIATNDGGDGLTFYKRLAHLHPVLLKPGGLLFVEIGYGQGNDVRSILTSSGLEIISTDFDYNSIERVISARKK